VIIYPHAFTQEHVETLVEIEIEYRELAHALGVPGFYRAGTVSTHPAFIEGLAAIVLERIERGSVKEGVTGRGRQNHLPRKLHALLYARGLCGIITHGIPDR
jgi:hypothetical protein